MRHSFKAALLAAAALNTMPAHAAEAEQDIIITATRAPAQAANLPAAVDVVDADEARARGQLTLDQALAAIPGVQAPRAGGIGQQTSVFSGGFESNHTLVLFDGVRIDDPSTPEGVFDAGQDLLGDAGRIEIVQGPMSALYGSQALGGVINILPRRGGPGPFNPRFEAGAGSFATLTATLGADGALSRLRYALTAEGYASEGYDAVPKRIAAHSGERDGADIRTLTGVFDLAVSNALALDLLLRRRSARVDYDPGFFGDIGENPFAAIQSETRLVALGAHWRASDALALRLRAGALATDREAFDAGIAGDAYRGERRFGEISATTSLGDWTLIGGGEFEDERINAVSFGAPVIGAEEHWGAFAGVQGALGALVVTGAVRHDDYQGFGGQTTWRAGVSYALGGSARVYGAYGVGYRAPSLYERFVPFFGNPFLDAETAETWELGADARFSLFGRDDGLSLGALYRSSAIDDLIGFFGWAYANVDRAEIKYAEVRAGLRPLDWLTLRASYANTDARDVSAATALLRRPRHAWSAEIAVARGPFAAQLSWREVGARLDTLYDDLGFWSGTGRVEAYDVLRASASWAASETVRLFIAGDNLADKTYEPINGFAGAPTSIMFGVRVRP